VKYLLCYYEIYTTFYRTLMDHAGRYPSYLNWLFNCIINLWTEEQPGFC